MVERVAYQTQALSPQESTILKPNDQNSTLPVPCFGLSPPLWRPLHQITHQLWSAASPAPDSPSPHMVQVLQRS